MVAWGWAWARQVEGVQPEQLAGESLLPPPHTSPCTLAAAHHIPATHRTHCTCSTSMHTAASSHAHHELRGHEAGRRGVPAQFEARRSACKASGQGERRGGREAQAGGRPDQSLQEEVWHSVCWRGAGCGGGV